MSEILCDAEIETLKHLCPCGKRFPINRHRSPKQDRLRALYFNAEANTDFCSALCMIRWHEHFWRPLQRHLHGR